MKMKEACRATSLTERAIRLYLAKNLLSPGHRNGIIDFSANDIRALKEIAVLRQHDFSIEQIAAMLHDPSAIPDIVGHRVDEAASAADHEQSVRRALSKLTDERFDNVSEFVARLNAQHADLPTLRFGQFDEISEEARQLEAEAARQDITRREHEARRQKPLLIVGGVFALFLIVAVVFLSQPRMAGYIALSPITIVEVRPEDITVSIDNSWAADVLGQSVITVPYASFGAPLTEGDAITEGAQLAVKLTNFDILRLGINPLQGFRTRSEEVNTAWRRTMLRALFATQNPPGVRLWIREISNLPPLLTPPATRTP